MARIPFGQKGYRAVQGTNMDYLTIFPPRSGATEYTRLHDVQYVPPIGGKLSDKARDGKPAGYKIATFYSPEAARFVKKNDTPWLVEIFKVTVYGAITMRGRLPKGMKPFKHFATLAEAKIFVAKTKRALQGMKK